MAERSEGSRSADDVEDEVDGGSVASEPDGGWSFASQAHYDPVESGDLTTVVVGAIAEAIDVGMTDVKEPPLFDVVDVAGIEAALFGRPEIARDGADSQVQFLYNEYKVAVEADGWVTVF